MGQGSRGSKSLRGTGAHMSRTVPSNQGQAKSERLSAAEQDFHCRAAISRCNVDLGGDSLKRLGFGHVNPKSVQKMDNATAGNIETLLDIGTASAKQIQKDHFGPFT